MGTRKENAEVLLETRARRMACDTSLGPFFQDERNKVYTMVTVFRNGCQRENTHKVTDTLKENADVLLETRARLYDVRYTIRPTLLRRAKRGIRHGIIVPKRLSTGEKNTQSHGHPEEKRRSVTGNPSTGYAIHH